MYSIQKIEKIFGNKNYDEYRFENTFEKSQFVNLNYLNSSNSSSKRNNRHKKQKNNISLFKKLFAKNENENIKSDKSNISNYVGKIDKVFNSEL